MKSVSSILHSAVSKLFEQIVDGTIEEKYGPYEKLELSALVEIMTAFRVRYDRLDGNKGDDNGRNV